MSIVNRTNVEVADQQTQVEVVASDPEIQQQDQNSTMTFRNREQNKAGVYSDTYVPLVKSKSQSQRNFRQKKVAQRRFKLKQGTDSFRDKVDTFRSED